GRRINRPSFWNLNPFKSLYTAHSYGEGNPYLQPEYNYNLEVSHAYKNIFRTSVFANKTENGFIYITMASVDTNLVYTRPLNFIETFRFGISESVVFKPVSWWESNALLSIYHTNAKSAIPEVDDISGIGAYSSIQNAIYLNSSKTFAAAINFWYQFPEVDHIAKADRYFKLDLGLKLTTNNRKWDLVFNANDVFMSSALAYSYTVNQIPQKFTNFQFNRFLQLNVNFRFGSSTTGDRGPSSGNEEEQARIH
ncbi:MAG TPA: outer membrane beta-barrel protein, partial [Flavitalea sp.]|nr:outer membrane beta-barrel protein [Flavitalea sp.]